MNDKKDRTYAGPSFAELQRMRKQASVKWRNSLRKNHR